MTDPRTGSYRHAPPPPRLAGALLALLGILLLLTALGLLLMRSAVLAATPEPGPGPTPPPSGNPASSGYDVPVRWVLVACPPPAQDPSGHRCAERWSYTTATACALDAAPDTWPAGTRLRCVRRARKLGLAAGGAR